MVRVLLIVSASALAAFSCSCAIPAPVDARPALAPPVRAQLSAPQQGYLALAQAGVARAAAR